MEPMDPAATAFRVISETKDVNGMCCGTLLTFERGSYQMVVDDDPRAKTLILHALQPPSSGAVQQQYVPGIAFFAIFENHVAIVQSAALRASGLEQHIAWLLRSQCGLLSTHHGIVLADEMVPATRDLIVSTGVKAVSIGRPFMESAPPTTEDGSIQVPSNAVRAKGTKKDVSKLRPSPGMLDVLRNFLPTDSFSRLNLEDAVFDGDLEVWLEIRYPAYTRSQPEDAARLVDNLAIAFRDQDEGSVELELLNGQKVKGPKLKITGPVSLRLIDGTPQVEEFYAEISGWLAEQIRNGVVSP